MRCEICTEAVHRELFQLHREEDYCRGKMEKTEDDSLSNLNI